MKALPLLPQMRFRFLVEDDQAKYGDDWWTYDESALVRMPARELVEIERHIGMSLRDMLNQVHLDYVDGNLAAMWVSRYLAGIRVERAGQSVPEPFDEFQPLVMLVDWETVPAAADVNPPAPASSSSPESTEA